MAKIAFAGIDEYRRKLEQIGRSSENIAKMAVYEGAAVVADEIRANIDSLPTQDTWGTKADPAGGIRKEQKEGLQNGFGISTMEEDGGNINVRAGFHGYNSFRTRKHPKGQPNVMIARSVESGTSFLRKSPFVRRAVRMSKPKAEAKMKEIFEKEIEKIMKE